MKTIVAVMLALAMALANVANAATWEHFNADPAYSSREAAIADAPRVMRQAGYPEPAISLLIEAMKKPGTETHVTNGMKLDFMRSGKSALWRNVEVKFKKPPREASMEYSAPAEEWTVDWNGNKWTIGIPKVCNNTYGKRTSAPTPQAPPTLAPAPKPPVTTAACPNGYLLVANAWSLAAMPEGLRKKAEELVASAEARDTKNASDVEAYKPDAFSRTLGGQLRREVKTRANVNANITVNLRDPRTFKVTGTLGVMDMVEGIGKMPLTNEQRQMVVETIWPNGFVSPAVSGGERRIELFFPEWGNNCTMNVHGSKP